MNLTEKARTMLPMMPPNYRLRLPPIWTTDALHGAFSSSAFPNCTVFPQAVANAASFDRAYLKKMARVAARPAANHRHALAHAVPTLNAVASSRAAL